MNDALSRGGSGVRPTRSRAAIVETAAATVIDHTHTPRRVPRRRMLASPTPPSLQTCGGSPPRLRSRHRDQSPRHFGTLPAVECGEIEALRAAAVAGHVGDVPTARALASSSSPEVRAAALGALARLGDVAVGPAVAAGLADEAASVRRRAAELAATVSAVPVTSVITALDDPEPLVAEAACFALGERQDASAVEALAGAACGHDDALVREAAVAALGAIGDQRGLRAVLAATSDKPAVRRRAVLALAPFQGPEVERALQRALEDRDWQVRQAAEDLLG